MRIEPMPVDTQLLHVVLASDRDFESRFRAWAATADVDNHADGEYELFGLLYVRLEQQDVEFPDRQRLAGVKRLFWTQHQVHHAAWRKSAAVMQEAGIEMLEPAELAIRRHLSPDHSAAFPGGPLPVIVRPQDFVAASRLVVGPGIRVVDHAWGSQLVTDEVWGAAQPDSGVALLTDDHAYLAAALWRGNGPESMGYRALLHIANDFGECDARRAFSLAALAKLEKRMRPRLGDVSVSNWPSPALLTPVRAANGFYDAGTVVGQKAWRALPLRVRTPLSPALNAVRRKVSSATGRR